MNPDRVLPLVGGVSADVRKKSPPLPAAGLVAAGLAAAGLDGAAPEMQ